ncbi:hypothetical protein ACLOJK_033291 [Asimina triloba]
MQVIDPPGCLGGDCDAPDPIQLFLRGCVLPMEVLVQRPKSHEFIHKKPFPTFTREDRVRCGIPWNSAQRQMPVSLFHKNTAKTISAKKIGI